MTKTEIKKLLDRYGIRPKKSLGQNFLIEQNIITKIINLAQIDQKDSVLEIGPGLGGLTRAITQTAKHVIAVEKDEKFCQILQELFKDCPNLSIINQDILRITERELKIKNYKILSNLSYYLTAPVIRKFLEIETPPREMILLIQKEVAQRICAKPHRMNLLAISVQYYAEPKILSYVSKDCFWPKPKVDSAMIKLIYAQKTKADSESFFKLVRAGFSAPRKQLANNLSKQLKISQEQIKKALTQCGLPLQVRAERLSVADWQQLKDYLYT